MAVRQPPGDAEVLLQQGGGERSRRPKVAEVQVRPPGAVAGQEGAKKRLLFSQYAEVGRLRCVTVTRVDAFVAERGAVRNAGCGSTSSAASERLRLSQSFLELCSQLYNLLVGEAEL